MKIHFKKLIYCLFMVFAAMAIGGYYNNAGVASWYQNLTKPVATPPDEIFPIVWTVLYLMMALAFYFAFVKEPSDEKCRRLNAWFITMLFLHILWSYAFFYIGYLGIALAVVIFIDILSYMIMMEFWHISKLSAWLFVPYFVWILFATYLNAAFINLNDYIIVIEQS